MPYAFSRIAFAAIPLLHLAAVHAAEDAPAAAPKAFAAPGTAASLPSSTAGGIGQATLALLLVLAAIFAIAWLARKVRNRVGGGGAQGIDVIAQAAVGPRERVVIVRVGGTRLLLGVAPGRVTPLHELPADATLDSGTGTALTTDAPKFPSFVDSLRAVMKGKFK